jgi:hypothetical protein
LTLNNYQGDQEKMTQYKKSVEKQRKKLQAEEDDKKIVWYEYQKGAGEHFRKIKYASGKEVKTDFKNEEQKK